MPTPPETPASENTPLALEIARRERAEARLAEALAKIVALKQRIDQAVAELAQREARTRQIIDTANDAFIETDIAGQITEWNRTAERLFAVKRDAALGRCIDEFLAPPGRRADATPSNADAGLGRSGLACVLDVLGDDVRGELVGVRGDRTTFPVEVSISMMIDDDRFVFCCFAHDITTRHAEQARRSRAQKLESIGQLAAGIAHEINTPTQFVRDNLEFLADAATDLASVIRAAEALAHHAAANATDQATRDAAAATLAASKHADTEYLLTEMPAAVSQALDGVGRIAEIVRSMKEFAHPGSGSPTPIDLNAAIRSTATVCRNEWKYIAQLELNLAESMPPVVCLPGEINQVVLNLIVNAAHAIDQAGRAGPEGASDGQPGRITIRTRRDADHAVITVADNGTGIPESIRHRIFDPFFTTKEVGKGTGQGLALVHAVIVDKHAGRIDISTEPGRGTAFDIRIPIAGTATPATTEPSARVAKEAA